MLLCRPEKDGEGNEPEKEVNRLPNEVEKGVHLQGKAVLRVTVSRVKQVLVERVEELETCDAGKNIRKHLHAEDSLLAHLLQFDDQTNWHIGIALLCRLEHLLVLLFRHPLDLERQHAHLNG